ncbi:MAG: gamma-glutamyl-gamma-aminobutyrate hydrolase family protein [Verrucomicrobiota bacterium]
MLLINAVTWSAAYPRRHRLRDVFQWYAQRLPTSPALDFKMIDAEADVVRAIRHGADGVIISGSPRDAWTDDPMNDKLCEAIFECRDLGVPFLGVCYGHQLLGRALGGEVAPHPKGFELGTIPIQLTTAGERFPLFAGIASEFEVLLSHADAVLTMPAGCELLATGSFTTIQSFHWNHQLMGVQFHPELDPESLRFIWSARRAVWRDKVTFDLDAVLDQLRPAPLAAKIFHNFVHHFMT